MPSSLTMLLPSALGFSPHPPVSVYGTGTANTIAAFLGSQGPRLRYSCSLHITSSNCRADFPTRLLLRLYRSFHSRLLFPFCVPAVLIYSSTGISTSCPSTTPFGLALGPDFPRADQLYSGNLGYSARRILTFFSLLIPAFSLQYNPQLLSVLLHLVFNAPLPIALRNPIASVSCFSPGHFRRRTSRLVSYYALFECVAASEPTS